MAYKAKKDSSAEDMRKEVDRLSKAAAEEEKQAALKRAKIEALLKAIEEKEKQKGEEKKEENKEDVQVVKMGVEKMVLAQRAKDTDVNMN